MDHSGNVSIPFELWGSAMPFRVRNVASIEDPGLVLRVRHDNSTGSGSTTWLATK